MREVVPILGTDPGLTLFRVPIRTTSYAATKFFNNQTPRGVLVRAYNDDPAITKFLNEVTSDVDFASNLLT